MKKLFIVPIMVLLAVGLIFINYANPESLGKPVKGGTLKCISATLPKVLGYPVEFTPTETIFTLPVLERLCEWDKNANYIPVLATSWESNPKALTFTWHLRKGVKFQDGTDWDAEALKWNFQILLDNKRLNDGEYVKSMEVVDKYTLRMNLTVYNWKMVESYGFHQMFSPTAFKKAGGNDIEKSKIWARMNAVGTGAFKISAYQRDTMIKYVRNENYWRKDMPYLDGMEVRLIADTVVASASLEAKEADVWLGANAVQNIIDLQKKGYKINKDPGMSMCLLPNSNDPKSILANKKVREAIEYAIDRPTLAQMLGQGLYESLTQISSKYSPAYVKGYDPRPFNPAKARKLLAEAGYPDGFKVKVLAADMSRDAISAIQSYLGNVGIVIEPDIADMGRFFGSVFGFGWKDLALAGHGNHPDGKELLIHFGPRPKTYMTGNIAKSSKFIALCNDSLALKYKKAADAAGALRLAVKQAGEDALVVPLYKTVNAAIMQPYVHSDNYTIHSIIWTAYDDWMEKH